jgi:uncharacterized protein (DUF1800 family)
MDVMETTTTTIQSPRRPRVLVGIAPYTGAFGTSELTHLLKRTLMGVSKADLDAFKGKTVETVVDALIKEPAVAATPPIRTYAAKTLPDNSKVDDPFAALGETWVGKSVKYPTNGVFDGDRRTSLRAWWMGQIINQERTIFEKMVVFWHNHFANESEETAAHRFFNQLTLLRKHALGTLKPFLKDITFDPSMLRYLNGYANKKTAPDENYGRELLELFTLGKGPDSKYTEDDVKAAAKLLTGWKDDYVETPVGSGKFQFVILFKDTDHDATSKTFSSFFGGKVITGGTTQAAAEKEVDDLITMILAQDEVAKHIVRKLYRYFVYYDIDATTESEVIKPLADIYRQNGYDVKPVLKALLMSQHFFDAANRSCYIKSPIEYVSGVFKEFKIAIPDATAYVEQYSAWNYVVGTSQNGAAGQGQQLSMPPNVAGWAAYYQEPVYHEYWINTDSFPRRVSFITKHLFNTGFNLGNSKTLIADFIKFTDQFGTDAGDPVKLIDAVLGLLYTVPVTAKFKNYAKNILLSGQASDYYWTEAWNTYKATPSASNLKIVNDRLKTFYQFILTQPEYHLS